MLAALRHSRLTDIHQMNGLKNFLQYASTVSPRYISSGRKWLLARRK